MSNVTNIPKKQIKRNTKRKLDTLESKANSVNEIKSIKIPEKFEEKEKLLQTLKHSIADIDTQMKNLRCRREYYMEIVEMIEKEVKERRELYYKTYSNNDKLSAIREELYNKVSFYTFTKNPNYLGDVLFLEHAHFNFNINNILTIKDEPTLIHDASGTQDNHKDKHQGEGMIIIEEEKESQAMSIIPSRQDNIIQENNNQFNYEDFNDFEQGEGLYTQTVETEQNLSDRFQVFALKPKTNKATERKILTKEFFSQQINSVGQVSESENELNRICPNISSKPDYEQFTEDKLKEECKKFGLKPGSSRAMIRQLGEIWEFMTNRILPENLKNELRQFLIDRNEHEESSKANNLGTSSVTGRTLTLTEQKKEKIRDTIIEEKELWIKILQFKKVELKEIKTVLNKKGIIIENEILKDFLNELGVVLEIN